MPLPAPKKGESQDDFHSRCMGDDVMKREYPKQEQRNAVCGSQWRKKHGGKKPEQGAGAMELNNLVIGPEQEACAAQHIGLWMIEPKWLADALAAVNAGLWVPIESRVPEEERRGYALDEDGLATVPIMGQMTKGGSSFGGCSTLAARRAIIGAVQDPQVQAVLLHIDSPGGTVAGTDELARTVAHADARKPVYAFIEDLGASAAYWVASQARSITTNKTARVGSIGTMAMVRDYSGAAEKAGVKVHVVSTGAHKGAFVPGTEIKDEHLAELQKMVDSLNQHFLAAVYEGRGIAMKDVREAADGRVFMADEALDRGLIDGIGDMADAVPRDDYGRLADEIDGTFTSTEGAEDMPGKELTLEQKLEIAREVAGGLTAEELRQHCGAVVAEIEHAAEIAGIKQERVRAQALARVTDEADLVVRAIIAGENAKDLEAAVGKKARVELKAAQEELAAQKAEIARLAGLNADGESAVGHEEAPVTTDSGGESDDNVLKANCQAEWDAGDEAMHKEYAGDFGLYLHYRRAKRDGAVKELKKERK